MCDRELYGCPTQRAPDPRDSTETMVVGVSAFSGSLRGLKLVPAKWRPLVPGERRDGAPIPPRRIEPIEITSGYRLSPKGDLRQDANANASRWAV